MSHIFTSYFTLFILLALSFNLKVHASSNGMVMSMDGPMDLAMGTMKPYLHFTPGDMLWFMGWVPESVGAMIGACIGLFLLGIIDRWIAASSGLMAAQWRKSAQLLVANKLNNSRPPTYTQISATRVRESEKVDETTIAVLPAPTSSSATVTEDMDISKTIRTGKNGGNVIPNPLAAWKTRVALPFIPSHDIPRGIIFATQSAIGFAFMLAIMTFQVAFILSICIGLGVGETLFGRYGGQGHHLF